jgi:hypothetical protein
VTAFFRGTEDLAPSTSATQAIAVMERIVAIPGFRLEYPTVYADQTVPFTMWARPAPLTGDLRLNASTWLKSGDFPVTAGDAHGSLDFDYGNYDNSGGYEIFAELRHSSSAAKGCPVTLKPQLRPDDPQLSVSPTSGTRTVMRRSAGTSTSRMAAEALSGACPSRERTTSGSP